MAWLSVISYSSGDAITKTIIENLGKDLRAPGGNVDYSGGPYSATGLASVTFASGGSNDGSSLLLKKAGQSMFQMWDTTGVATHKRGQLLYDGGAVVTGGAWVFQKLDDSGVFSANLVTIIQSTGYVGIGTVTPTSPLQVVGVPVYANNAAAIAGGLTAGAAYRITGTDGAAWVH